MVKTLAEWYIEYRSHINPITGERPKYKDITDQMIWDAAFKAGKAEIKRPDILVCDSCKKKGGNSQCFECNIGNLFEKD
jgi:hypothetical protein